MMSDEALVDLAPGIVVARVVSVEPASAPRLPSTDYSVEVERTLKGRVPGSTLSVRVPGGIGPNGLGFHVFGAPRFEVGDRVILFVSPTTDGTFRLYQLMLGAFHERRVDGERLALRDFAETREVEVPGVRSEKELREARAPRRLDAFVHWIADRARGEQRERDYFLQPSEISDEVRNQLEAFRLFEDPLDGLNLRWFAFDGGETITFQVDEDGQPGLTLQQFQTAVLRGAFAWSIVPGTNIRYTASGTTAATGGLSVSNDSVNGVTTEDPNHNGQFGGPYNCVFGGVLAIGGPWFTAATMAGPGGEQFHRIVEGDVITNQNIGCFFDASADRQAAADELFTHELGHTLGIAHSCGDAAAGLCNTPLENEAIMRATVHDDGRGARLHDDDRRAARALYPSSLFTPAIPTLDGVGFALLTILLLAGGLMMLRRRRSSL